ncbi:MAG TPA: hypothetical protein VNL72_03120 [Gammaproteobacteria bacterium]|nr:hypothetical protein [Gammaproteobacteria bacterium]
MQTRSAVRSFFPVWCGICTLSRGPQDIPGSLQAVGAALAGYLAATVALLVAQDVESARIPGLALADATLLAVCGALLLYLRGLPHRLPQTLAALYGTGALLTLLVVPVVAWIGGAESGASLNPLPVLLLLMLLGWQVAVIGHILRHALDMPGWAGLALAVLYTLFSWWLFMVAFPADT